MRLMPRSFFEQWLIPFSFERVHQCYQKPRQSYIYNPFVVGRSNMTHTIAPSWKWRLKPVQTTFRFRSGSIQPSVVRDGKLSDSRSHLFQALLSSESASFLRCQKQPGAMQRVWLHRFVPSEAGLWVSICPQWPSWPIESSIWIPHRSLFLLHTDGAWFPPVLNTYLFVSTLPLSRYLIYF